MPGVLSERWPVDDTAWWNMARRTFARAAGHAGPFPCDHPNCDRTGKWELNGPVEFLSCDHHRRPLKAIADAGPGGDNGSRERQPNLSDNGSQAPDDNPHESDGTTPEACAYCGDVWPCAGADHA